MKDQASIDTEGRREYLIRAGKSTAVRAGYIGARYLTYHKTRKVTGSIVIAGFIRAADGKTRVPVSRVRAGQRVYLANTGETLFIRHTALDVENQRLTISPDAPTDNLDDLFAWKNRTERLQQQAAAAKHSRLA